jgi:hypothetical protein
MATSIDTSDDEVRAIIERAKVVGTIGRTELSVLLGKVDSIYVDEIEDLLVALAEMGISFHDEITEEEQARQDEDVYDGIRAWTHRGGTFQWTGDAWLSIERHLARVRAEDCSKPD